MKFSPLSIIPEQYRATTPDVFITDQYGKVPDQNGDGLSLVNDAVRLSRIASHMTPAFANDNSIILGYNITSVQIINDDLFIKIDPGLGIINERVFRIPYPIEVVWKNFANTLPTYFNKAKVLIYFVHHELIINSTNRPCEQDYTRYPTKTYPEDQSTFNPIQIRGSFYDPDSKQLIQESDWDVEDPKILITGSIWYEKKDDGSVSITFDEDDRDKIEIIHPGNEGEEDTEESLDQQGGGHYDKQLIDGGAIDEENEVFDKEPSGIKLIFQKIVDREDEKFQLPYQIRDVNNTYVFYNGVLYQKKIDWDVDELNRIYFKNNVLKPGHVIYIFENIVTSPFGSMKNVYSNNVITDTTQIQVSGLVSGQEYLVFVNGIVIEPEDYSITTNQIEFNFEIKNGTWVNINHIIPAYSEPRNLQIIYRGNASDSSTLKTFGINTNKCYLVFYNGILYFEPYDYFLGQNAITFRDILMRSNKKILVIGV